MDQRGVYNLLFAGVGGQGTLLAAEVTALAAVRAGYDVKQTEVHGVSQRGGSVETHLRYGGRVWSPTVMPGEADVVIGLEKLEALRFASFAHPERGVVLANDYEVVPGSVANAAEHYPHHAFDFLRDKGYRLLILPASSLAREHGDGRMANMVLTGALSTLLSIPHDVWLETLDARIPQKYRQANLAAFASGRKAVAGQAAHAPLAAFPAVSPRRELR
ncbi:MAG TPA: indolepyruvate oxidoreductase subunit beta [Anaerolineales bacterium]|nr:indolepyruvate oxidoreductase subunit beta [Anaerolineales bacterium]